jgi:hypothetical protein
MRELWRALAIEFRRRKAARIGTGVRDVLVDFKALLLAADCNDVDKHAAAEHVLREASREGWLTLETHRRDPSLPMQVRLPLQSEATLFARLGQTSPSVRREGVARQFERAADNEIPLPWRDRWRAWCIDKAAAVRDGRSLLPFNREDETANVELLTLLPRLLAWRGESLLRFASCVLCGDSKRLAQLAGSAGRALREITDGRMVSLEQLGILQNPRSVLINGPLRLLFDGESLDLGLLHGPSRVSAVDVQRADGLTTNGSRCLTVENETSFHELAKLNSGVLLVQTSYPGAATLTLLSRLPEQIELWHFGDTDPEGFDILRDLRERLGRHVHALHMTFRATDTPQRLSDNDRRILRRLLSSPTLVDVHPALQEMQLSDTLGDYEQESLGRPTIPNWPFYDSTVQHSQSRGVC